MQEKLLEVCVDSVASAVAAAAGGADRLELCSGLVVGGLTPDTALFSLVREKVKIPVNCLIRPRFGDFLYTDDEVEQQRRAISALRAAGADGFVFGCLTADGRLDKAKTAVLAEAAAGCRRTLHRAFDVTRDADEALADAVALGFDTVLTSGQAANCLEGRAVLERLVENAGKLTILAGAGVNAEAVRVLRREAGVAAFHASCKRELPSGMVYRREGVPMGLPGLDEFTVWQTDAEAVRATKAAVEA